ncbi:ileal sodium/bile acid cotransporter-like [Ptychodera flava]|uniref:ileal sodium/bile acid cotransporter-like n=1 Tax=Ptychodera flava TaxID=63121 RepID=UPI00396A6CDD
MPRDMLRATRITAFDLLFLLIFSVSRMTTAENETLATFDFIPPNIKSLVEGQDRDVLVNHSALADDMLLTVVASDDKVFRVLNPVVFVNRQQPVFTNASNTSDITGNSTFRVHGIRLGKASLKFHLTRTDGSELPKNDTPRFPEFQVWVLRPIRIVDQIFPYAIVLVLVLNTCTMGCKLQWSVIKSLLVRPASVSIGACCQFIGMPLFAFTISVAFSLPPESAFGLLLIGCCPGGGLSNIFSFLLDGDLTLSITMTFCSTLLALGMMPLNLFIYSHYWTSGGKRFPVPYITIIVSLALLCIPVGIGMALRHFKPTVAKKGIKLIRPMGILLILLALSTGVYSNIYLVYQWDLVILACSFLLPVAGFALGAVAALVFKREAPKVKTISMETGIQNSALATALIQLMYDQPDRDLMSVVPLTCATGQFLMVTFAYVILVIYKRCRRKSLEHKYSREEINDSDGETEGKDGDQHSPVTTSTGMISVVSGDIVPDHGESHPTTPSDKESNQLLI